MKNISQKNMFSVYFKVSMFSKRKIEVIKRYTFHQPSTKYSIWSLFTWAQIPTIGVNELESIILNWMEVNQ